jgi:hypothetical protein
MKEIAQARVLAPGDRYRLEPAMCHDWTPSYLVKNTSHDLTCK